MPLLEAAYVSAPVGLAVMDRELRFVSINVALAAINGRPADQHLGRTLREVVPQVADQVEPIYQRVWETGAPITEVAIEEPAGSPDRRAWIASFYPVRDRDRTIVAAACVVRDVTEQKRAERALRESEARFRAMCDASPVGIFLTDPRGASVYANEVNLRQMGITQEESAGSGWQRAIHPDDAAQVFADFAAATATGSLYSRVNRYLHRDGRVVWVDVKASGIYDGPVLLGFVGVTEDISHRIAAEGALKASEERFRQLAETLDDVFWLASADGAQIIYVSPAYRKVWGRNEDGLYARPGSFLESIDPRDRDKVRSALDQQADGGYDLEYRIVRPGGSIAWIRHRGYPIRDGRGVTYRVAGVACDVTARKLLEEQLLQAQKMEGIGRLAGGVAHDFNNLLSVILSYTSLAMEDLGAGHPVGASLDQVRRAGESARKLTGQLLAFSRQQVLNRRVVDLNHILRGVEDMLRRLLGEDVDLVLRMSGNLGRVLADPGQTEQVIMNLAVNARDAMPAGGKLVLETANVELDRAYASAHSGVAPGPYVMLEVTDTGLGMDAATRSRIFEPFFTTKEKGKGTGLGLSTVFGIVQQSGGHISVSSDPGRGTTFKIYFPRTDPGSESIAAAPVAPATLSGSETILLVEDEDQVRAVACTILRRHGYHVLEAQNAGEALLIFEKRAEEIRLLITDLVMPRVSGAELADRLVSLRPELRTLYMSGYTDSSSRPGVTAPGFAFLQKPLTPDLLLTRVREVLDSPARPRAG
jgi:PAS domain S-box-containing protein